MRRKMRNNGNILCEKITQNSSLMKELQHLFVNDNGLYVAYVPIALGILDICILQTIFKIVLTKLLLRSLLICFLQ